jgi:hypothetical protein
VEDLLQQAAVVALHVPVFIYLFAIGKGRGINDRQIKSFKLSFAADRL